MTRSVFRKQAEACGNLGSPFTARLLALLADRLHPKNSVGRALLDWPRDPGKDALPLRVAGALHALVLTKRSPELLELYPPSTPISETSRLWHAVETAFEQFEAFILAFIDSPPQTNEVARSAALAGGFLTIAKMTEKPLAILELGASAGLNLYWDHFAFDLGGFRCGARNGVPLIKPVWQGPRPPEYAPKIISRAGCDQAPIDRSSPEQVLRLRAYIWPDQTERLQRLDQALATVAGSGLRVDRADAVIWAERRLRKLPEKAVTVLYHSIFWQYLDADCQARLTALVQAAGRRASRHTAFVWLQMEPGPGGAAALRLKLWPDDRAWMLAEVDYHGRWIRWKA